MAWWYDRSAIETTLKIRDQFNINTYIETGTFRGINIFFHSYNFRDIYGVEINNEYAKISGKRVRDRGNVIVLHMESCKFLSLYADLYRKTNRHDTLFIYLDAHFYVPGENKTKEERWVVLRELKALAGFENCVLAVHDFNCGNGLYGLIYDNDPLNFELLKDSLYKINAEFKYYVNIRENCQPHTEESIINVPGIIPDPDTIETIRYHARFDRLKYRGILYCTPKPLDIKLFSLRELE